MFHVNNILAIEYTQQERRKTTTKNVKRKSGYSVIRFPTSFVEFTKKCWYFWRFFFYSRAILWFGYWRLAMCHAEYHASHLLQKLPNSMGPIRQKKPHQNLVNDVSGWFFCPISINQRRMANGQRPINIPNITRLLKFDKIIAIACYIFLSFVSSFALLANSTTRNYQSIVYDSFRSAI